MCIDSITVNTVSLLYKSLFGLKNIFFCICCCFKTIYWKVMLALQFYLSVLIYPFSFSDLSFFYYYSDPVWFGNTEQHLHNGWIERRENQDILKWTQKFHTSAKWGIVLVLAGTELIFIIVVCMAPWFDSSFWPVFLLLPFWFSSSRVNSELVITK